MSTTTERYTLTLQALPGAYWPPAIIRLRRVLKYALRVCGLRCVAIRPATDVDLLTELEAGHMKASRWSAGA
jgi:hypothetical protein